MDPPKGGELGTRDQLARAPTVARFAVLPSEGTYFLNVDLDMSGRQGSDLDFAAASLWRRASLRSLPAF